MVNTYFTSRFGRMRPSSGIYDCQLLLWIVKRTENFYSLHLKYSDTIQYSNCRTYMPDDGLMWPKHVVKCMGTWIKLWWINNIKSVALIRLHFLYTCRHKVPKDGIWRTFLFQIEVYIWPEITYYGHYTFSGPIMTQTLKSRKNFQIQIKF